MDRGLSCSLLFLLPSIVIHQQHSGKAWRPLIANFVSFSSNGPQRPILRTLSLPLFWYYDFMILSSLPQADIS